MTAKPVGPYTDAEYPAFFAATIGVTSPPATLAVDSESARCDVWMALQSHVQLADVWARAEVASDLTVVTVSGAVRLVDSRNRDTAFAALEKYITGVTSLHSLVAELQRSYPQASFRILASSVLGYVSVLDQPVPQQVNRSPATAPPQQQQQPAVSTGLQSPRPTEIMQYIQSQPHRYDPDYQFRTKYPPQGGFKVDDLILGRLPPTSRHVAAHEESRGRGVAARHSPGYFDEPAQTVEARRDTCFGNVWHRHTPPPPAAPVHSDSDAYEGPHRVRSKAPRAGLTAPSPRRSGAADGYPSMYADDDAEDGQQTRGRARRASSPASSQSSGRRPSASRRSTAGGVEYW